VSEPLPEPADPADITPFEEQPEVAGAVEWDTTVTGLPGDDAGAGDPAAPDPDTPEFREP
jgi:hypothetical protein